jgi:DinB superfamily
MPDQMQEDIVVLVQHMAAVPERLVRALADKSPRQLGGRPGPDEWSVIEVFAHMRAVDDIMTARIYMLMTRSNVLFADLDERRWADIAHYVNRDIHQSLTLFTLRRIEVVTALRHLFVEDWQRKGLHEIKGMQSLFSIVQNLAIHEEEHCTQIEKLLS